MAALKVSHLRQHLLKNRTWDPATVELVSVERWVGHTRPYVTSQRPCSSNNGEQDAVWVAGIDDSESKERRQGGVAH